ncbi:MAG TPA: hypothetical protein VGZ01_06445, partial [Trinickia sp.]|nr:hypothetical protein [Trinickia sp.]
FERGEDGVSNKALAAVQRAFEEAGIEFPNGTLQPSMKLRLRHHGISADDSEAVRTAARRGASHGSWST